MKPNLDNWRSRISYKFSDKKIGAFEKDKGHITQQALKRAKQHQTTTEPAPNPHGSNHKNR